jgi:glycosyltransferase involved in cell wall biosynthesis
MRDSVLIINWGLLFLRGGGESSALELYNLYSHSPSIKRVEIACANFCINRRKHSSKLINTKISKLPSLIFYWSSTASGLHLLTWIKRILKWGSLFAFEIQATIYALFFHRRSLIICSDMYLAAFLVSHLTSGSRVLLRLHGEPKSSIQKWLCKNARFEIISNGLDGLSNIVNHNRIHRLSVPLPDYFSMTATELESKWKVESYHILYAGRFEKMKGADRLLNYISELTNRFPISSVTVCGDGLLSDTVQQQVTALNKQSVNTTLLGNMTRREVSDLLKKSHLMLLPSRKDFSPNVVREALASGCIIITSRDIHGQFKDCSNIFCIDELDGIDAPLIFNEDTEPTGRPDDWLKFTL